LTPLECLRETVPGLAALTTHRRAFRLHWRTIRALVLVIIFASRINAIWKAPVWGSWIKHTGTLHDCSMIQCSHAVYILRFGNSKSLNWARKRAVSHCVAWKDSSSLRFLLERSVSLENVRDSTVCYLDLFEFDETACQAVTGTAFWRCRPVGVSYASIFPWQCGQSVVFPTMLCFTKQTRQTFMRSDSWETGASAVTCNRSQFSIRSLSIVTQ
jgi:hypothetical protein